MHHHKILIRRASTEELTIAAVTFDSTESGYLSPRDVLRKIRAACTRWAQAPEGREAWELSSGDFNAGDLLSWTDGGEDPSDQLSIELAKEGIHKLSIEILCSTDIQDEWRFDDKLMEV